MVKKPKTDTKEGDLGACRQRNIPDVYDKHWDSLVKIKDSYKLTWGDVFSRFEQYQNGLEYIFTAPAEVTKPMRLDLNTVMSLATEWINAIRENWYITHKHGDIIKLISDEIKNHPCIVVGAGPSLKINKSLERIKDSNFQKNGGIVISTLHSLKWCLEAGIVPNYTVCVDSNDKMHPFIDSELVDKYADQVTLIGCCAMNPLTLKRWKGNKMAFCTTSVSMFLIPNLDTFMGVLLPEFSLIDTGGNAGTSCVNLMACLNANPIALVGMDFGYPKGHPYDQTMYYNAYMQSVGREYKDAQDMISRIFKDFHHPDFNTDYYYDFVYAVFRDTLHEMAKAYQDKFGTKMFNCTEGGVISSDDIQCVPLEKYLSWIDSGTYKDLQKPEY